ncbi:MAG: zinc-binding dehydrogenase [Deltaproteobacteria bacterium]|nr:zinc-binding dehydrogenase [Deltaproteobacteria bacterium]
MMKAVVKYAPGVGNVELRDVEEPRPKPGYVVAEVKAAGVCGSELHLYHNTLQFKLRTPVIMGHEFSGIISAVGEGVQGWKAGDRVVCETTSYHCGTCIPCRQGCYNHCIERKVIGMYDNGCFTSYILIHESRVHRLPDNIDFHAGVLIEPLACCVVTVTEITKVLSGDLVVVAGPGTIGILSLQLAKAAGAYTVIYGTAQDRHRLELAKRLGADESLIIDETDIVEHILRLSGGHGADIFLECSGAPSAARQGFRLTRRMGKYTQIGLADKPFEVDLAQIAYRGLKVRGAAGQKWPAWERALNLVTRGKVDTRPLVSHVMPLSQWEEAFHTFENKKGVKILLEPEKE